MPRHLLTLLDYTEDEILGMIRDAMEYKRMRRSGRRMTGELGGRSVALIFEKPSTRTRASMVTAVYEMGGMPVVYSRGELQLSRGEPVADTVRVLSRYHDLIAARVYKHSTLEEMAEHSEVPVVNLLSDRFHPLQALADYMTVLELKGRVEGVKIAFIGDGTDNVLNSLMVAGVKLGARITVACPPEYRPDEGLLSLLEGGRGSVEVTDDPLEAAEGADVVYTDVFVSMGQEAERERRLRAFLPRYRVTPEVVSRCKEDYIFMHCLPAKRGEEVTSEVIDDPRHSVVFEQAENRLHTAKAVLKFLLGGG